MVEVMDKDVRAVRLGALFRQLRKKRQMTLHQMAARMGLSINTIRQHEAGTRLLRVPEIWRAAEVLRVNPNILTTIKPHREEAHAG